MADAASDLSAEQAQLYESILQTMPDALVIRDLETFTIVEVNQAYCRMHGKTRAELIGTTFVDPAFWTLYEQHKEVIQAGAPFRLQGQETLIDHIVRYVEVSGQLITYRNRPHLLVSLRENSERMDRYLQMQQRVDERSRELATLLHISNDITLMLSLPPLLDQILEQLKEVVEYDAAGVFLCIEPHHLELLHYKGPIPEEKLPVRWSLQPAAGEADAAHGREVIESGAPVIVENVHGTSAQEVAYRRRIIQLVGALPDYVGTWMGVPLLRKERVTGMIAFDHGEPGYYTQRHATLAMAVASQAAIAIENARLYEQAQQASALRERQRLARDLHDSVAQVLYSIGLGLRTASDLLEQAPGDPDWKQRVQQPLEYARTLAQAGLVETRALIFELRPESLAQDGLVNALEQQAERLRVRHGLTVQTQWTTEPEIALPVKEALYRVGQEALNNALKHAQATQITLSLQQEDGQLTLTVQDNGCGFDPTTDFPGHWGLRSMRERIESIDGSFALESTLDGGTSVCVSVPLA